MALPNNICVGWPSTNASIPAGWAEETALATMYVQAAGTGADADLSTSRGAASHTHSETGTHTPTQNQHRHTFSTSYGPDVALTANAGTSGASGTHTHASANGNYATATHQANASSVSLAANTSNDLDYVVVVWIKTSGGTAVALPQNCYAWFAGDSFPANWSRVTGNKYLKGATVGGDGGGTGGSNTHTHTESGSHTHTQDTHTHSDATSSGGSASGGGSGSSSAVPRQAHTHTVSFSTDTATNASVTVTVASDSHEPVYKKLNVIQNTTADSLPDQVIALWLGTHAGIPAVDGWARFTDMDGYFAKGANADGESNVTTSGATTHTHSGTTCQVVQNAHGHTATSGVATGTTVKKGTGSSSTSAGGHVHLDGSGLEGFVIDNATATTAACAMTIAANTSESGYPPYRRVIFIQYTALVAGTALQDPIMTFGIVPFPR